MASVAERLTAARRRLEARRPARGRRRARRRGARAPRRSAGIAPTLVVRGRDPSRRSSPRASTPSSQARRARARAPRSPASREFWGLDFEVTPDVLIPRPETELVVEAALAFCRGSIRPAIVDVGTGSGCLAVAIADELPDATSQRSTICGGARGRPAQRRHVTASRDRVTFRHGDVLDGLQGRADLIVSNPPYVPEADAASMQRRTSCATNRTWPSSWQHRLRRASSGSFARRPITLHPAGNSLLNSASARPSRSSARRSAGWRIVRVRDDLQAIPRTIVFEQDTECLTASSAESSPARFRPRSSTRTTSWSPSRTSPAGADPHPRHPEAPHRDAQRSRGRRRRAGGSDGAARRRDREGAGYWRTAATRVLFNATPGARPDGVPHPSAPGRAAA